jgi:hypothetical protein
MFYFVSRYSSQVQRYFRNFLPSLALLTPWFLPDIAGMAAMELQITAKFLAPVLATFLWSVNFIIVALKKFQRYEF